MTSVIDAVRADGANAISDTEGLFADIQSFLAAESAPEAVAVALEIDADAAVAASGAVAGFSVGVVLLIVLLIFIVVFALLNLFRDRLGSIPLVGGKLQDMVDTVDAFLLRPAHWTENRFREVYLGTLVHARTFIWSILGIRGVPGLRQIRALIGLAFSPLANLITSIETHVIHIDEVVTTTQAHLGAYAHSLWSRIQAIEDWVSASARRLAAIDFTIHWIRQNITQLWTWAHQFYTWIKALQAGVATLFGLVTLLQSEVRSLQHKVSTLERELDELSKVAVPAAEAVAVLTLLYPLVESGPAGIATLQKLANDPCHCFKLPGSIGFLLEAIVSDLALTEGL